jgi:hypothetical protein
MIRIRPTETKKDNDNIMKDFKKNYGPEIFMEPNFTCVTDSEINNIFRAKQAINRTTQSTITQGSDL